jgi:hypothetical protein
MAPFLLRLIATILVAPAWTMWATDNCRKVQKAKPDEQLEYLKGNRAALVPPCLMAAFDGLGYKRFTPAIPLLIQFLDFKRPYETLCCRAGGYTWVYPAGEALLEIGRPAVPALVEAIAGSNTPEVIRKNAAGVLNEMFWNWQEPTGAISLLVRESRAPRDGPESQRLLDAARELASNCRAETRPTCIDALTR